MSWEQLGSIQQQAAADHRAAEVGPPVACPRHGEPLDVHRDGRRNCPYGDYIWNGGPKQ